MSFRKSPDRRFDISPSRNSHWANAVGQSSALPRKRVWGTVSIVAQSREQSYRIVRLLSANADRALPIPAVPPFFSSGPPTESLPLAVTRVSLRKRQDIFRRRRLDLSACHRQRSWRGRKCRRVHGDPVGVFVATREPSNGTQRCSGREPLVPMMELAGYCHVWTPPVLS